MKDIQKFYPIQKGIDNPILRKISEKIEKIDEDIQNFGEELMELMLLNDGAGLAAPQVGKNIRMIATTQWKESKKDMKFLGKTLMINPEIIEKSKEMIISEEACLSLPRLKGNVRRYKSIVVQYLNLKGNKQIKKFKDLSAFIVQHEYDHLDGILFVDKILKNSGKGKVES